MRLPVQIPCVTREVRAGRFAGFEEQPFLLYSPSAGLAKLPVSSREGITLLDCHTYYLARRQRNYELAVKHYKWFADFCLDHATAPGVVCIAPDSDWLPSDMDVEVSDYWLNRCHELPQLVVPHTILWRELPEVEGYAVRETQNDFHPFWTHSLGATRKIDVPSEFWTCDSMSFSLR